MSYSETSYQNWIQEQLEPDRIIVGRMKREPSTISALNEKWRNIKKMREEMGEEAFMQKEKEWQEWELSKYKEEHDL